MPSDFGEDTWIEHADRRADAEEERRNATREPILQSWPSSLGKNRMSQDELLAIMRRKIIERTKRYGRRYLLCGARCTVPPPDPSHTINVQTCRLTGLKTNSVKVTAAAAAAAPPPLLHSIPGLTRVLHCSCCCCCCVLSRLLPHTQPQPTSCLDHQWMVSRPSRWATFCGTWAWSCQTTKCAACSKKSIPTVGSPQLQPTSQHAH